MRSQVAVAPHRETHSAYVCTRSCDPWFGVGRPPAAYRRGNVVPSLAPQRRFDSSGGHAASRARRCGGQLEGQRARLPPARELRPRLAARDMAPHWRRPIGRIAVQARERALIGRPARIGYRSRRRGSSSRAHPEGGSAARPARLTAQGGDKEQNGCPALDPGLLERGRGRLSAASHPDVGRASTAIGEGPGPRPESG